MGGGGEGGAGEEEGSGACECTLSTRLLNLDDGAWSCEAAFSETWTLSRAGCKAGVGAGEEDGGGACGWTLSTRLLKLSRLGCEAGVALGRVGLAGERPLLCCSWGQNKVL